MDKIILKLHLYYIITKGGINMIYFKNKIRIMYESNIPNGIGFNTEVGLVNDLLGVLYDYSQDITFHCIRVCRFSAIIGKYYDISDNEMRLLCLASILHDIGKTAVPKSILDKSSSLNNYEYAAVKKHSYAGYIMVNEYTNLNDSAEFILYHHERYDGNGYPNGIHGEEIPFISRIISVADAFDAMTSERPYRNALTKSEAMEELNKGKWKQFDGEIVEGFIDILKNSGDKCKTVVAVEKKFD